MSSEPCGYPAALTRFVAGMDRLLEGSASEAAIVSGAAELIRELIRTDDWLAPEFASPHPTFYRQYLLHGDARGRYSVVSFVWGPGQKTPVHDHGVWGVIGMLRGQEISQTYREAQGRIAPDGPEIRLEPGDVAVVSPTVGDIHLVRNAFEGVSISIHVYGADIGKQRRHVFDLGTGATKDFVSGYANSCEETG